MRSIVEAMKRFSHAGNEEVLAEINEATETTLVVCRVENTRLRSLSS